MQAITSTLPTVLAALQSTPDWSSVLKIYGPLGVGCVLAIALVKVLLNYIRKQHEEHVEVLEKAKTDQVAALEKVVTDARTERDYVRVLREKEVDKFIDSLKLRDEKMERGFDEVVRSLRAIGK